MKTRILVIADDPATHDLLLQSLPSHEYQVCTTANAVGAVFQLYLAQPDLIIVDLPQRVAEGRKTLQQMRELSSVPVIALVPHDDEAARIDYLNQGADQCMTRPFDGRELEARARALLRRVQVRQAAHRAFERFAAERR